MRKLSVPMNRMETILGIIYIVIQLLVLPILVSIADIVFSLGLNDAQLNFICFSVNFIAVTAILHRYLLESAKVFLEAPGKVLGVCGTGFCLYFAATTAVGMLIVVLEPDFANANDASIAGMVAESSVLMTIGTVLLAPVVEELLFRGVIFGQLYRKWPVVAYIVSAAIFASLHVVGYIGMYAPLRLALCFLQYLPASFVLAWIYVRADTIFAPILVHIAINTIGMSAMQ